MVLSIKPTSLHMLGKHWTTELYHHPLAFNSARTVITTHTFFKVLGIVHFPVYHFLPSSYLKGGRVTLPMRNCSQVAFLFPSWLLFKKKKSAWRRRRKRKGRKQRHFRVLMASLYRIWVQGRIIKDKVKVFISHKLAWINFFSKNWK